MDGLILVVLFPHLPAFGKGGNPALSLDDLSGQIIVRAVHISDFFMELAYAGNDQTTTYKLYMELQLNYARKFGKHDVTAMMLYTH